MLRIRRDDVETGRVVLILEGHIVADWAEVLELECEDLRRGGLRVALDLSGVVFISLSGIEALGRLRKAGVAIKGCSPLIADMLEQEGIEVERNVEDRNDRTIPWKRGGETDA